MPGFRGDGESDHPTPELVTIQSDACVLSLLIGDLRTGAYGGPAFQHVVLVGHSVGSAISVYEVAFFSPDALLRVLVIPQASHVLNLQRNATLWEADAIQWINSSVAS
jgi:hypothetical protein